MRKAAKGSWCSCSSSCFSVIRVWYFNTSVLRRDSSALYILSVGGVNAADFSSLSLFFSSTNFVGFGFSFRVFRLLNRF